MNLCLTKLGSQVLRGTAGLALGFRNCSSTPCEAFHSLEAGESPGGQERPGEGVWGPRDGISHRTRDSVSCLRTGLVFSPSDFTSSRRRPVLGAWAACPRPVPSSCSLLSPSLGGGHSLSLLPFFLVGRGSLLWAEPGLRGPVNCRGPSPVTAPPPGSCCEVVGPEADRLCPVLPRRPDCLPHGGPAPPLPRQLLGVNRCGLLPAKTGTQGPPSRHTRASQEGPE